MSVGETGALVPTIEARDAQSTVESDRERIFADITSTAGSIEQFNSTLQENLERALRTAAAEVQVNWGGVGCTPPQRRRMLGGGTVVPERAMAGAEEEELGLGAQPLAPSASAT